MDNETKAKYFSIFKNIKEEHLNPLTLNSRILIVDSLNTFIRSYSVDSTVNEDGLHVGGISGTLKSITYAAKMVNPTRVILVFDGAGGSVRRRKLYPEYKAKRRTKINVLRKDYFGDDAEADTKNQQRQLLRLMQYVYNLPVTIISIDNIEADDTIAYLATEIFKDSKVTIMSSDKDFLQLVSDNISVWSPTKKLMFTPELMYKTYSLTPENFLIYRLFTGDDADNIDGVYGVGDKRLKQFYPYLFESTGKVVVDDLVNTAIERFRENKFYQNIANSIKIIDRNMKLMKLHDIDISAGAKLSIQKQIQNPINRFNKTEFLKLMLDDRMNIGVKDPVEWLQKTYSKVDYYITTQKKEKE
jgi:DNA polymerase-1